MSQGLKNVNLPAEAEEGIWVFEASVKDLDSEDRWVPRLDDAVSASAVDNAHSATANLSLNNEWTEMSRLS